MPTANLAMTTPFTFPSADFTVARYALETQPSLNVREVLPFAEQLRRALIYQRTEATHSETITGKTQAGKPLADHQHAHYLATDEDHDGLLDQVTVYAPRGFDAEDLEALKTVQGVSRFDRPWKVRTLLVGFGHTNSFDVPMFQTARRWCSVTPFSLPRFASRGAGKPPRPRDLPEAQLVRELQSRGFPEPISITRIEGYAPNNRPLLRWLEFQTRRFNGTEGYGLAGFEIEFAEEIPGPIALGFGCHFGLGLFLPIE